MTELNTQIELIVSEIIGATRKSKTLEDLAQANTNGINDITKLVKNLSLYNVSSMFSAKQMEQAFNDGAEAEQDRCGEFNIENYC